MYDARFVLVEKLLLKLIVALFVRFLFFNLSLIISLDAFVEKKILRQVLLYRKWGIRHVSSAQKQESRYKELAQLAVENSGQLMDFVSHYRNAFAIISHSYLRIHTKKMADHESKIETTRRKVVKNGSCLNP